MLAKVKKLWPEDTKPLDVYPAFSNDHKAEARRTSQHTPAFFQPTPKSSPDILDEDMAKSAFGRGSDTAKKLRI